MKYSKQGSDDKKVMQAALWKREKGTSSEITAAPQAVVRGMN